MSRQCPGILLMLVCAAQWAGGAEPAQPTAVVDFLAADRDTSVSPGDDFFEYANGGWLKRNPIPATEHSWGIDFLVREQTSERPLARRRQAAWLETHEAQKTIASADGAMKRIRNASTSISCPSGAIP